MHSGSINLLSWQPWDTLMRYKRSNVRQLCDNQMKQPWWDWWSTLSVPWYSADECCHILLSHNLSDSFSGLRGRWRSWSVSWCVRPPTQLFPLPLYLFQTQRFFHLSSINHTILINSAGVPGHRSPLRAQLVLLEGPSDVDASPGAWFSNNIRTQCGTWRSQVSFLDATWDSEICIEKNLLLNIKKIYVQNCTLIYNGKLKLMILYILIWTVWVCRKPNQTVFSLGR